MKSWHFATPFALFAAVICAQQPGSASLRGIVVRQGSTAPIQGATVQMRPAGSNAVPFVTTTDDEGRFYFQKIPPGSYEPAVQRNGYLNNSSPSLLLSAGDKLDELRIALTPGAAISGRVTDHGHVMGNVAVIALQASFNGCQRTLSEVLSTYTDDHGDYSLYGMNPGRYYVAALGGTPPNSVFLNPRGSTDSVFGQEASTRSVMNRPVGISDSDQYVPSYYPGTSNWTVAKTIDVHSGDDVRNISIDASPLPVRHVRGNVTGAVNPAGLSVSANLTLVNVNLVDAINARSSPDGTFDIPVSIPGSYVLYASIGAAAASPPALAPGSNAGITASGRTEIEVHDRDVNDVAINLKPVLNLSGTLVIEGRATPESTGYGAMSLVLHPDPCLSGAPQYTVSAGRGGARGRGAPAGSAAQFIAESPENLRASFSNLNVPPGKYRVLVEPIQTNSSPPPSPTAAIQAALQVAYDAVQDTFVKSLRFGSKDLLREDLDLQDQPSDRIEIVIGIHRGSLVGHAFKNGKAPDAEARVVLVPETDPQNAALYKSSVSSVSGEFHIETIVPGIYRLFAWDNLEESALKDPDFLRQYEGMGTKVEVKAGERTEASIEVISVKP